MPKKIKPRTFNQFLAKAIQAAMDQKGLLRGELATLAHIHLSTLDRNFAGSTDAGWTANQVVRIANVLGEDPGELLDTALTAMGGIDALMSEVRPISDDLATKRRRKQAEAAAMTPEQIEAQQHAATRDTELEQDEPPAP